jgi:hypothetical protein
MVCRTTVINSRLQYDWMLHGKKCITRNKKIRLVIIGEIIPFPKVSFNV